MNKMIKCSETRVVAGFAFYPVFTTGIKWDKMKLYFVHFLIKTRQIVKEQAGVAGIY